jgi:AcrR family transcriptional regulator
MDTKHKIMDEALTLFSEKGYANVFVADIAEKVGIKAPSLYKHYKNKKAIFDAIIEEMNTRFLQEAGALQINGADAVADANIYKQISEEQLITLGKNLFLYFLHDDYTRRFRKMLTIEQFHDKELATAYMKQYVDDPLSYQGMLLGLMASSGVLQTENVEIMTLHFYAPIYLLLTVCDREPEREAQSLKTLEEHIRQFNRLYSRDEKVNKTNEKKSRRNIK